MSGFDVTAPTPRVNAEQLAQFVGKRVLLVGKFESISDSTMQIRSADNNLVSVQLQAVAPAQVDIAEFDCMVNSPNTVTADAIWVYPSDFDLANYNELCKLANTPAYRHMFLA